MVAKSEFADMGVSSKVCASFGGTLKALENALDFGKNSYNLHTYFLGRKI